MAKKDTATEVAEVKKAGLPVEVDIAADADEFGEAFGKEDLALPFIQILQALSPQLDESSSAYIPGAKRGMLYNTVTGETFDGNNGITIVPVMYKRSFIEWVKREDGGGFVAEYAPDEAEKIKTFRDEKKRDTVAQDSPLGTAGNQIAHTATYFVFHYREDEKTWAPAIMSLASTQLKKSRQWNARLNNLRVPHQGKRIRPPMFYTAWKVTTVPEKNESGSWHGWKFDYIHPVTDLDGGADLYLDARMFRESFNTEDGTVASYQAAGERGAQSDGAEEAGGSYDSGGTEKEDENIPF